MQYGFKAHEVKREPIALQLLELTLELGLQLRFTRLGGCEPVNSSLKIKTAGNRLLSIAMRDRALRRSPDMRFFLGYR